MSNEREAFEKWCIDFQPDWYSYPVENGYNAWQARGRLDAERIAELEAKLEIMSEALEKLAKLGNEPLYGTSDGNTIAKIALVRAGRV